MTDITAQTEALIAEGEANAAKAPKNLEFTTRDLPWMKLGTVIDEPVSVAEAMKLSGLNYDVELRKEGFMNGKGNWVVDPTRKKVVRVDTDAPLGTVSTDYEVLQYRDAFDFIASIDPNVRAAGELKGGKQAFMVVQAPDHWTLEGPDGDSHQLYLVLRTSHDGSIAVENSVMCIRNACMNAIGLNGWGNGRGYNGQAKQKWSIRHTKNLRDKLAQAREAILGLEKYAEEFTDISKKLAAIDLELDAAREVFADVVKNQQSWLKDQERVVDELTHTYRESPFNGFVGTGWGVVNAVSEYYEHVRGSDRANRTLETRFNQDLDGVTRNMVNATARRLLVRR